MSARSPPEVPHQTTRTDAELLPDVRCSCKNVLEQQISDILYPYAGSIFAIGAGINEQAHVPELRLHFYH